MSKFGWRILFVLVGALAFFGGFKASMGMWTYQRLGTEVQVEEAKWEVIPKGSKYALQGTYSYEFGGKKYFGRSKLGKPYFLNRLSAEREVQKISGMQWTAYVDANQPGVSSLENKFPLKNILYGVCLIGIFLYFVYLKFHVELLSKSM